MYSKHFKLSVNRTSGHAGRETTIVIMCMRYPKITFTPSTPPPTLTLPLIDMYSD